MKKMIAIIITLILCITMIGGCGNSKAETPSSDTSATTAETETTKVVKTSEKKLTMDDLAALRKAGILSGIEDYILVAGTKANLLSLMAADSSVVKEVKIDDSKVKKDVPGKYEVTYTFLLDGAKLDEYENKNGSNLGFENGCSTITATAVVTIEVMSEEDAAKIIEAQNNGTLKDSRKIIRPDTEKDVAESNKDQIKNNVSDGKDIESTANAVSQSVPYNAPASGDNKPADEQKTANNNPANSGGQETPTSPRPQDNPTEPTTQHSHSYTRSVDWNATCGQDGRATYRCACGSSYTETIPATGNHQYDGGVVTREATTEAEGVITYTCNGCGRTYTESIPKVVHTHSYTLTDSNYAVYSYAYEVYTCSCGDSYTVDLGWKPCNHSGGADYHLTGRVACNACHQTFESKDAFIEHTADRFLVERELLEADPNWRNEYGTIHAGAFTWEQAETCNVCGEILAYTPSWAIR